MWDLRDVANLDGKREQTAIGQSTTVFLLRIQIRRYGRKLADILAVSPTDLSILVNGKRPWRGNLKEHHQQLVNPSVNTPEGFSQLRGSSLRNSKDLPLSRPLPSRSGAKEGTRTLTSLSWQRMLSHSGAHPPSDAVRRICHSATSARGGHEAVAGASHWSAGASLSTFCPHGAARGFN